MWKPTQSWRERVNSTQKNHRHSAGLNPWQLRPKIHSDRVCISLSQVLGELPEHCVFTLVYSLPIYWLAGLNDSPDRFLLNFLLAWLMVYCSRCMALFAAAVLPTLQTSSFMGNSLFTVFYLTGGFVISLDNMWLGKYLTRLPANYWEIHQAVVLISVFLPSVASWFSYISFMRWGFDGMLQVQFRGLQYSVSLGNLTINVDGIKVRIHGL